MQSPSTRLARRMVAGAFALALAAAPVVAEAQQEKKRTTKGRTTTGTRSSQGIPPGHIPAAGQCRVWVTGTPPGRQSEPTDCATATRRAAETPNARVIVGRNKAARKGGSIACDGRTLRYPTTAPGMRQGARLKDGQVVGRISAWNLRNVVVGLTDRQGDGVPETISWRTAEGATLQTWHDFDNDGTADMVQVYCNGQEVRQLWY